MGLEDNSGVWQGSDEDIQSIVLNYFSSIYQSDNPSQFSPVIDAIEKRVTDEMNDFLLKEFQPDEVQLALHQMHPTKSPGPDGMPPLFFQKYWSIVGQDVIDCVLNILNTGEMPPRLNDTYICLIPKIKNPQKITDFRPISLCNVMYRILAKVLANRLKKILPEVVSKSQSASVPGRLITDNVLVAFELMHHINQKRKGKDGQMAIKLDMIKAFDRVEWECLARIMQKLEFHDRWISIIMMCISTVSYSVLINGKPKGEIIPSRGIRQGDPLSPFLFLLCAEGLSAMLQKEERLGNIKGISICRGAPHISHLFFADDSIIFCRANMGDCRRIWDVLQDYGAASWQKINKDKTSLSFSKNTIAFVQAEIKCLFGAQVIKQHDRYLGLPSLIGRGKKKAFNRIKDQLSRKLAGWKGKLLSAAGKEPYLYHELFQVTGLFMQRP